MKHLFLSLFFIAALNGMELDKKPLEPSESKFDENAEFNLHFGKLQNDRQTFIVRFLVESEEEQCSLARTIYQNPQSVLNGKLEHDESLALFSTLKLLGYPSEPRTEAFKSLPQPVRAFIEKFKTWDPLYQAKIILTDIDKDPLTQQARPDFNNLHLEHYRNIIKVFATMGYNIMEPEQSRNLSPEQIRKVKKEQKELKEQKKRLENES